MKGTRVFLGTGFFASQQFLRLQQGKVVLLKLISPYSLALLIFLKIRMCTVIRKRKNKKTI
jgi:hypothetical protein